MQIYIIFCILTYFNFFHYNKLFFINQPYVGIYEYITDMYNTYYINIMHNTDKLLIQHFNTIILIHAQS